ncbi:NAD-dependent protein deacetylase [Pyxidicoccus fallax]|uniref:protein acetyllysine N-acetyltransferase n=1 Tax=Pyxidicoccus fallax TaxID=394095 RepID=A0A848LD35_9BACT|nr:Sir2 family NAD-dependent protein deacetylase [Pyxidicoccus fallax]NMO16990.1 NAD-dependent protein deacetylase [Pyxidicoccus fallax]NPC84451.1 NAD-dependent protein deacetylase [Pyxidicoccus fallax]
MSHPDFRRAAEVIRSADALLIGAGAGMGVDSGLPDFRGTEGFWKAYPAYEKLGLDLGSMANPQWFESDPELAWGFYGHRLGLYRATEPHPGFSLLRDWASRMRHGAFVFTSNVDGHFQKAGFAEERIVEVHGSLHFVQCLGGTCKGVQPAAPYTVDVDLETFRARQPLPRCATCGALVRPNILMFLDPGWEYARSRDQRQRLDRWLEEVRPRRLAIIECGAGKAIPSVRGFCEVKAQAHDATLIRINVREADVPREDDIRLPFKALEALRAIDEELRRA